MCIDMQRVGAQYKVHSYNTFVRVMAQVTCPTESSRLVNTASKDCSTPRQQVSVCISCPSSRHLCLPSKAAILILLWTVIVGTMYHTLVGTSAFFVMIFPVSNNPSSVHMYEPIPYAVLALVMMFYPLSGFIADVCCGRLKTVVVSLLFVLLSMILVLVSLAVLVGLSKSPVTLDVPNQWHAGHIVAFVILYCLSPFAFVVGLAGYQANFMQLGLDQLFEASSRYLGIFIHYATWCFHIGSLLVLGNILMLLCLKNNATFVGIQDLVVPFVFVVLLLAGCWKREWFHNQLRHQSPYKTVYGVIKFAKNHKFPLKRSAFTYCYDYIPSRLDFAKERFGGPFTTEQVEDVKTFLRILLVLFAVGPVFALEVPASYFVAPLFFEHFHPYWAGEPYSCTSKAGMGSLVELACWIVVPVIVLFPLYVWIVFFLLQRRTVKLFVRLGMGIVVCLLGIVCLLITDVVGHATNTSNSDNLTLCVFQLSLLESHPTLDLPWAVSIPPTILLGIGTLLVTATTLEFISAQSPQYMKGLLVGVFFAIRGLFQFLNSVVIIPLSLKQPWASSEMIEHPPVTNCGFVYLLLTSVTGLIGLILFTSAAKRYKYRTRDEGMFRQQVVEDIYDRYVIQASS